MKKGALKGAFFVCFFSNVVIVEGVAKIDNVKDENYISIRNAKKKKR